PRWCSSSLESFRSASTSSNRAKGPIVFSRSSLSRVRHRCTPGITSSRSPRGPSEQPSQTPCRRMRSAYRHRPRSSHTTRSISGAGARGAPLANLMVDELLKAGVLGRGAAYWLGRALKASPGKDPLHAIERAAAHPEKLPALSEADDRALRDEMRAEARSAVR